jgi:hypothetical protein
LDKMSTVFGTGLLDFGAENDRTGLISFIFFMKRVSAPDRRPEIDKKSPQRAQRTLRKTGDRETEDKGTGRHGEGVKG